MLKLAKLLIAVVLVLTGLYLAIFGNAWGPRAFELLSDSELGEWVGLIVPFLPMAFIGLGATVFVSRHR
jgi:hypothetical protein